MLCDVNVICLATSKIQHFKHDPTTLRGCVQRVVLGLRYLYDPVCCVSALVIS